MRHAELDSASVYRTHIPKIMQAGARTQRFRNKFGMTLIKKNNMENKLPKGWVETNVKVVSEIIRGVSYKKEQAFSDNFDNSVYVLRGGNIQDNKIDFDTDDNVYVGKQLVNSIQLVKESDVVIVGSTGSKKLIGKAGIATHDLENVSFGAFLMLLRTKYINKKYHSYFFQTKYYRNSISELAGGVNINNIRKEYLENLVFPLPPLAEQERIVAKLDKLFAQHEKIKAALDRIPQLLKDFRQQVLAQAVTGKLTEQWREGKDLEEWKIQTIHGLVNDFRKDVKTGPFGSALKKSDHRLTGLPVLGIESIGANGKFTGINKIFITVEKAKELSSFKVNGGDIIISRSGTVGELCIIPNQYEEAYISTNLLKIALNNKVINSLFFCWMFKADPNILEDLKEQCKGSTRLFLTQAILKNLQYNIPPLQEQQEIVRRVESLFAKADAIETRYQTLKGKIDNLPKAILHKAFKGELVSQLPTDGDAKDLLAEIMAFQEETKGKRGKA